MSRGVQIFWYIPIHNYATLKGVINCINYLRKAKWDPCWKAKLCWNKEDLMKQQNSLVKIDFRKAD